MINKGRFGDNYLISFLLLLIACLNFENNKSVNKLWVARSMEAKT